MTAARTLAARQTVADSSVVAYSWARAHLVTARHRLASDERGEGVISAAIVVLIMAFLGAAMWVAFRTIFNDTTENTSSQVSSIGQP
ncbi:MAG: hypothetical protein GXY13_04005 [Acidimicrobiales bacterium]|nr:hypothetical protein [Acidimicrobiales bacterium]